LKTISGTTDTRKHMGWRDRRGRSIARVPGIEPRSDGRELVYDGDQLAGRAAVVAALATAPSEFVETDANGDVAYGSVSLTPEVLLKLVSLGTQDGRTWAITMEDEVAHGPARAATDGLRDAGERDWFLGPTAAVMAADLGAAWAQEPDREYIDLTLDEPIPADLVLASFVRAVVTEYRYALWRAGVVDQEHPDELGQAAADRVRSARASAVVQAVEADVRALGTEDA